MLEAVRAGSFSGFGMSR